MLEIYKILNGIYDRHEGWFTPNRFAWSDEAGTSGNVPRSACLICVPPSLKLDIKDITFACLQILSHWSFLFMHDAMGRFYHLCVCKSYGKPKKTGSPRKHGHKHTADKATVEVNDDGGAQVDGNTVSTAGRLINEDRHVRIACALIDIFAEVPGLSLFLSPSGSFLKSQWPSVYELSVRPQILKHMPLSAEEEAAGKLRGVWGYDMCGIHDVPAVQLKVIVEDKMELVSPNAHSTHKCQPQDHN